MCRPGESCALPCAVPPCHLDCVGDNPSCRGACANGECHCGSGSHCEFSCQSPPCHVTCASTSECKGVCANGDCRCENGSSCDFACTAPPCHVACVGANPQCNGECSNGNCNCGSDSSCHFRCLVGNCRSICGVGSSCVLECPDGRAGDPTCRFETCAAGEPVICPGARSRCVAARAQPADPTSVAQRPPRARAGRKTAQKWPGAGPRSPLCVGVPDKRLSQRRGVSSLTACGGVMVSGTIDRVVWSFSNKN